MKRLAAAVMSAVFVVALSSAAAQAQTEDSVTGTISNVGGDVVDFDAHSGPSGENPTGTVTVFPVGQGPQQLDVYCLAVSGNRATIGLGPVSISFFALFFVEDNGPAGSDRAAFVFFPRDFMPSCTDSPVPTLQSVTGDIVVTDAQPFPTSQAQCKNGGWGDFGVFKNQGDCVSFVRHQARQACIFERVAHGVAAFRAKYGRPPDQVNAMARCIRRKIGT